MRLDDRSITELDPGALRRTVLVAPHHADLLEPTVLLNVATESSTDAGPALDALRVARCESLVNELPQGYATPVSDRGRTLSGGQRQRVALARAVNRRPAVLVLIDPTSSVDAATELDIAYRLRTARRGATTLVITSSPAFHFVADHSVEAATVPS